MRKLVFINETEFKKIMIYEAGHEEVYIFYYDTWIDAPSIRDDLFSTYNEAEELCWIKYNIKPSDWIDISDPMIGCQQDFISPVRVSGRNTNNPEFGKFEMLKYNGDWVRMAPPDKNYSINGMTGNERKFLSGLMNEFDDSINKRAVLNARKILMALQWDEKTADQIVEDKIGFRGKL